MFSPKSAGQKFKTWNFPQNVVAESVVPLFFFNRRIAIALTTSKSKEHYGGLMDPSSCNHLDEDFRTLCSLTRNGKYSEVETLLNQPEWRLPIDYQDIIGNTVLHIACQNGNKRIVKLCLRRGASINLQNVDGLTALHFAYGFGFRDLGDYLVSKGADATILSRRGLTAFEGIDANALLAL